LYVQSLLVKLYTIHCVTSHQSITIIHKTTNIKMNTRDLMIQLPGYECQLNQDGVTHSRKKVESALNNLMDGILGGDEEPIILLNYANIPPHCNQKLSTSNSTVTCGTP
jgi:hypothetical protein